MADKHKHGGDTSANYTIFTAEADGLYNVSIYVGNTAVCAYCNVENRNVIDSILNKIDYLSS